MFAMKISAAIATLIGLMKRPPDKAALAGFVKTLKHVHRVRRVPCVGLHVWSVTLNCWVPLYGTDANERFPPVFYPEILMEILEQPIQIGQ